MSVAMARMSGADGAVRQSPWLDPWLLVPLVFLLALGLVMVTSASLHLSTGGSLGYVQKHLLAIGLGAIGILLVTQVPIAKWEQHGALLYFAGLIPLVLVLIPGIGVKAGEAYRWLQLGPFRLQPSEFMKLFAIIYMSGYLLRRQEEVQQRASGFLKPMILLCVASLLIIKEPDFGTVVVILSTSLGMLFLAGAPLWQFAALVGLAGSAMAALIYFVSYRMERVTSFLDPFADPTDSGYQLAQALIAFGRGEITGVGLGSGIMKQHYLPEAHTDFLMAVVGEELGLLGVLAVVIAFAVLIGRAFHLGQCADRKGRPFAAHLANGLGIWLGLQAVINIGVNVGLFPTKGLTLPFMSYGSNSLIVSCLAAGLLLRVFYECRSPRLAGGDK